MAERAQHELYRLVRVAHYRATARRRGEILCAEDGGLFVLDSESGERQLYFSLLAEATKAGDL